MRPGILEVNGVRAWIDHNGIWESDDSQVELPIRLWRPVAEVGPGHARNVTRADCQTLAANLNRAYPPLSTVCGEPWAIAFYTFVKDSGTTVIQEPEADEYPDDVVM